MQISGKWVIGFIFGAALAMAIFAWSFQYLRGRRVLALYGAEAARLIRVDAARVELLRLERPARGMVLDNAELLQIEGETLLISDSINITRARGLIHARQALIEDSSYSWDRPLNECAPRWDFALRFSRGDVQATAMVDVRCQELLLVETGESAPLAEHFVAGMQTFVDEQLAEHEKRPSTPARR